MPNPESATGDKEMKKAGNVTWLRITETQLAVLLLRKGDSLARTSKA